ncbi:5936_t:CDS:10 [Entrophospora sp. SA101]|nr:5936_t:CDS:10 [Entrophospora sp. SA101]
MLSKSMPNSSNYKSFSLQQSKQHSSNFPWSQKKLHTFNPFPRYNHSASEFDHNDSIIIFGGIVGEKTTNEVYVVEATYGDIPKPRSLHSQISFATHMIVFGGIVDDPKENNLDEHIYIFDIVSKHWLKQMICNFNIDGEVSTINSSSSNGSIGRFGHTATVVDTTLYVFGGKNKNNEYLNDFLTFDLKALKLLTKKKSKFKFSSRFGGCASPNFTQSFWDSLIPPRNAPSPRMKHVSCPYNGKIYMFGGTDEIKCYNDIWCYDVKTNQWDELECSGYTPQAREGHGATIMNDVIYIFGGRSEEGEVLGDLAAFRITNKRWYKFPKLSPSPCPRYGITVSKVKNNILVFGGDSKKDPRPDNEGIVHILDTTKIKFPSGDNTSGHQQNQDQQLSQEIISGSSSSPYPKKTKLSPVLEEAILLSSQESILKLSSTNKDVKGKQKAQQEAQQRQARSQQIQQEAQQELSGTTKSNTVEIKEHDNYKPHKTYVEYSNTPGKVSFDGKIPNNQSNLTKSLRGNIRNAVIIENNDFNIIDNGSDNSIGNGIDNNENEEDQNPVLNNDDNITRTLPLQDSQLYQQHNHQMEKNDSSVEGSGTLSKKSSFEKLREGSPVNNNNIQQRPRGARPLDKKTIFIPIRMNNNNVNNVDVGIIVGSKTEQVLIPESPIIPIHNHHIQQQQQTILSSTLENDEFFRELEKQKQNIIDAKKRENLMKSTKELEFNSCGNEIMNNLEVGSDKYKIVDVIVKMKQQLKYYKTNIKLQSQLASQKISESEKSRIDALDEVATIKLQNLQINQLKQVLKEQQMIFDKVQKTLVIANKRADDTEQRLKDSSQEVATLEKEMSSLKLELTNKSRLLDKSLKKSDELERLLIKAQSEDNNDENDEYDDYFEYDNNNIIIENNIYDNVDDIGDDNVVDDNNDGNQYLLI